MTRCHKMTFILLTMIMTLTLLMTPATPSDPSDEHQSHVNDVGYYLRRTGRIYFQSGIARFVYNYSLPDISYAPGADEFFSDYSDAIMVVKCAGFNAPRDAHTTRCIWTTSVVRSLHNLRRYMLSSLRSRSHEIQNLLFDITHYGRSKIGLASVIGSGIVWGLGLATEADIGEIQYLLREVLESTEKAIDSWRVGQSLVTRLTALTSKRFKNVDRLLNMTRRSLIDDHLRLVRLMGQSYATTRLLAIAIKEMHECIEHTQELETLYTGLHDLSQSRLSRHLVHQSQLDESINYMINLLREEAPGTHLIYDMPHYYYTHADVIGIMYNEYVARTLVIIEKVPLTIIEPIHSPLIMWQMKYVELKAPDNENYYAKITNGPKFIIHDNDNPYYLTAQDLSDLPLRPQSGGVNHIDIRDAAVALKSASNDDCAMALIKHNLLLIKRHCKHHIISDYLQPAVYRIGENKLLLNNISSLIVSRVERKLDSRNDANDTVVEI